MPKAMNQYAVTYLLKHHKSGAPMGQRTGKLLAADEAGARARFKKEWAPTAELLEVKLIGAAPEPKAKTPAAPKKAAEPKAAKPKAAPKAAKTLTPKEEAGLKAASDAIKSAAAKKSPRKGSVSTQPQA